MHAVAWFVDVLTSCDARSFVSRRHRSARSTFAIDDRSRRPTIDVRNAVRVAGLIDAPGATDAADALMHRPSARAVLSHDVHESLGASNAMSRVRGRSRGSSW